MLLLLILVLILFANGAPVLLQRFFPSPLTSYPVDGNRVWRDGNRILGNSKSIAGLLASLLVTSTVAPIIGLDWSTGFKVSLFAMMGDILSSFIKRRLSYQPSDMAIGLDQIPESLFPLLWARSHYHLSAIEVVIGVVLFIVLELALSKILYIFRIRKRPY